MSTLSDELLITMTDITKAGYCARGTKGWFERKGLDFRDFLKNGIAAEDLLATEDAMAARVVDSKIKREWLDMEPAGIVVTIEDLRASRKCMDGARRFAKAYGYSWPEFVEKGITSEELLATGSRDALLMIRAKLERERG